MKAMVLAAGLGTRLRPLTDGKPKALVPFRGVPMVEGVIRRIAGAGIDQVIVNVHHFAGELTGFLSGLSIPGCRIRISDESGRLMDTGGAILKARDHFRGEKAFLVHNVDVYTNLDISSLIETHLKEGCLATMAVKKRSTSRSLLFDPGGLLAGWRHNETGEERIVAGRKGEFQDYGNSCVQVIDSAFFDHFPETKPFSLVDMFLELAAVHKIRAYVHNEDYWFDLGRYENFLHAEKEIF